MTANRPIFASQLRVLLASLDEKRLRRGLTISQARHLETR